MVTISVGALGYTADITETSSESAMPLAKDMLVDAVIAHSPLLNVVVAIGDGVLVVNVPAPDGITIVVPTRPLWSLGDDRALLNDIIHYNNIIFFERFPK
jgi:hypothetical protein